MCHVVNGADRTRGFTLVELLVVLAIVAIIATVAMPNYGRFVNESRLDSTRDLLSSSLSLARTEAVKRGELVVICARKANTAQTCRGNSAAANQTDWSQGWILFTQSDNRFDAADITPPAASLIRIREPLDDGVSLSWSHGDFLAFDAAGLPDNLETPASFAVSAAGLNQALTVLPSGRINLAD